MSKKRIGINGINIKGQNRKKRTGLLNCLTDKGDEIELADELKNARKRRRRSSASIE